MFNNIFGLGNDPISNALAVFDPMSGRRNNMMMMGQNPFANMFDQMNMINQQMMQNNNMFSNMMQLHQNPANLSSVMMAPQQGGVSHMSSFTFSSNGAGGTPYVYQESQSTRVGPNGVKEVKKTVKDSKTGKQKMIVGHHIGNRAHVIENERDLRTGEEEEQEEFINIDEEEAPQFTEEWKRKLSSNSHSGGRRHIAYHNDGIHNHNNFNSNTNHGHHFSSNGNGPLAITYHANPNTDSINSNCHRNKNMESNQPTTSHVNKSKMGHNKKSKMTYLSKK